MIVKDGIVELWGTITDERERQAMMVAAENMPGVKAVRDRLVWIEPTTVWSFIRRTTTLRSKGVVNYSQCWSFPSMNIRPDTVAIGALIGGTQTSLGVLRRPRTITATIMAAAVAA